MKERTAWLVALTAVLALACNPPAATTPDPTAETATPTATVSPVSTSAAVASETATSTSTATATAEAGPAACTEGKHVGDKSKTAPAVYTACKDNSECSVVTTRGCCEEHYSAVTSRYSHCIAPDGPGANCRARCPLMPTKLVGSECRKGHCALIK